MDKTNLVIIGGGIIGITIAREAAHNKLFSNITVIEKETNLGIHASTRNSGVIHAGFYYSPDSFKAKLLQAQNIPTILVTLETSQLFSELLKFLQQ